MFIDKRKKPSEILAMFYLKSQSQIAKKKPGSLFHALERGMSGTFQKMKFVPACNQHISWFRSGVCVVEVAPHQCSHRISNKIPWIYAGQLGVCSNPKGCKHRASVATCLYLSRSLVSGIRLNKFRKQGVLICGCNHKGNVKE